MSSPRALSCIVLACLLALPAAALAGAVPVQVFGTPNVNVVNSPLEVSAAKTLPVEVANSPNVRVTNSPTVTVGNGPGSPVPVAVSNGPDSPVVVRQESDCHVLKHLGTISGGTLSDAVYLDWPEGYMFLVQTVALNCDEPGYVNFPVKHVGGWTVYMPLCYAPEGDVTAVENYAGGILLEDTHAACSIHRRASGSLTLGYALLITGRLIPKPVAE